MLEVLGKGSFSEVIKVWHKNEGRNYALKIQ